MSIVAIVLQAFGVPTRMTAATAASKVFDQGGGGLLVACAVIARFLLIGICAEGVISWRWAVHRPRGRANAAWRGLRFGFLTWLLASLPFLALIVATWQVTEAGEALRALLAGAVPWLLAAVALAVWLTPANGAESPVAVNGSTGGRRGRRLGCLAPVGLGLTLLWHVFATGPRVGVSGPIPFKSVPTNLATIDERLAAAEASVPGVVPGTEKGVVWAGEPGSKTGRSIVFLHGFSATRRELSPCCEQIASELGANLFMTRLTGHGRGPQGFRDATAEDWLADAAEALAIGRALGDGVVVIGSSTGGTLATWLAAEYQGLEAIVLLSPNFGVKYEDFGERLEAAVVQGPWGRQLAALSRPDRMFVLFPNPENEAHAKYFTTKLRIEGVLALFALMEHVTQSDLSRVEVPCICLYTPHDEIVDYRAIFRTCGRFRSERLTVRSRPEFTRHTLAGDILAPHSTDAVREEVVGFLRRLDETSNRSTVQDRSGNG